MAERDDLLSAALRAEHERLTEGSYTDVDDMRRWADHAVVLENEVLALRAERDLLAAALDMENLYPQHLAEVERLVALGPEPGTPEARRLDALAKLVERFEEKHGHGAQTDT